MHRQQRRYQAFASDVGNQTGGAGRERRGRRSLSGISHSQGAISTVTRWEQHPVACPGAPSGIQGHPLSPGGGGGGGGGGEDVSEV
jgi:hypothetical protein